MYERSTLVVLLWRINHLNQWNWPLNSVHCSHMLQGSCSYILNGLCHESDTIFCVFIIQNRIILYQLWHEIVSWQFLQPESIDIDIISAPQRILFEKIINIIVVDLPWMDNIRLNSFLSGFVSSVICKWTKVEIM